MVFSTNVADGEDILAAQYNNLRLDVLDPTTGHDHDGTSTGGKKVDHGDLLDTNAISGTYITHAKLNKHMQGTGTSADPDATGGAQGVHGLASAVYVQGSCEDQLVTQFGINVVANCDGQGGPWYQALGYVTFNREYDSAPAVHVTWSEDSMGSPSVFDVTAQGFTAGFRRPVTGGSSYSGTFNWTAVGEISA